MKIGKGAALVAVLAVPAIMASLPAAASTARQYTFQGHGLYMTSKGLPENVIGIPSAQDEGLNGSERNQVKDFEHHNRYFGGS